MANVINFYSKLRRADAPAPRSRGADATVQGRSPLVRGLQSRVKADVYKSIMLLDLAAQHAREIETRITDPAVKRAFEVHVDAIEDAIQIARERALDL